MNSTDDLEQECQSLIDELERTHPVQVTIRQSHLGAFMGGGGDTAVVAFLFGAIAGGFLSAVGEDLWAKAKALCKRIHDHNKARKDDSETIVLATLEYKGLQVTAHLNLDKRSQQELETMYRGDPLGYFWEGVPIQLGQVIKLIHEGNPSVLSAKALGLTLDNQKPTWTVTRYVETVCAEDFIRRREKGKLKEPSR